MQCERELVASAQSGDSDAFAEIVRKYANAIYSVALSKVSDYHEAQDIVQEVFLKAYLNLTDLREPAKIGSWLYSITARLCADRLREKARQCLFVVGDAYAISAFTAAQPTTGANVEEQILRNEMRQIVWEALQRLSDANREVVVLFHLVGYSLKEVAAFLNISVAAVDSRLRRARRQLRGEMMDIIVDDLGQHRHIEGVEDHQKILVQSVPLRIVS